MDIKYRFRTMLAGIAGITFTAMPVLAEDIEIYTTGALAAPTVQPNVMFIVDSSVSMLDPVTVPVNYDYTVTYTGCYETNGIYYTALGTPPACGDKNWVDKASNKCDSSLQLYSGGVVIDPIGPLLKYGYYSDQMAQRKQQGANYSWQAMESKNAADRALPIECKTDTGIHGETSSSKPYIEDNNGGGWTNTVPADPTQPHPIWYGAANNLQLYDGNYLNYRVDPSVTTATSTRIDVVKDAVQAIVSNNNNINIGLMRFDETSWQWDGGAVIYPAIDVKASRNDFNTRLANKVDADSSTTLAETYYEALLYFGGKPIVFGNLANPSNQTGTKENGNPSNYETPITDECQKNYIILLSDGAPQLDYINSTLRGNLTGFDVGSCNTDPDPGFDFALEPYNLDAFDSAGSTVDNCLDELAGWARNKDVAERSFPAHDGEQNITTYTVGFAFPPGASQVLLDAEQLLKDTATQGGGSFHEAENKDALTSVFNQILAEILAVNSTFSSPAVSVNAFNRATNLDDLYFTLFKPASGEHWEGNFKKFKLKFTPDTGDLDSDGDTTELVPFIADKNGDPAVDDATGFFTDSSVSYWTESADAPDGAETAKGGAAGKLTNVRNMYTMAGTYTSAAGVLTPVQPDLTVSANELGKTNALVTDVMLNIVGYLPLPEFDPTPYRETLLDWAAGIDVWDEDGDLSNTDARRMMGDPLHAEPALVQYGMVGTEPDLVAYVATNDGYLQAFNTLDGTEYFSFVPQEMLPKLDNIFQDTGVNGKQYGLDGNVVAWINDADNDGTVSGTGEHVYLYFGMRRGGRYIYSMDVTDRSSPDLRWVIDGGSGDYAELGETWSTVNVERLNMGGVEKVVLIFGGGYDTGQDTAFTRATDGVGRAIYIVDAETGERLWWAGPTGSGADLELANMDYSIPARIKPLDINNDRYIDRLYAADMGGQIWRIDIDNDANTGSTVVATGGRFADLAADADINDTRRFYYPPDAALIIQEGQAPFIAVVAGSGYRAHPLQTDVHDRMYMLRDYDVYSAPASYTTITEADLFDTTDNIIGEGNQSQIDTATASLNSAKGWYITLNELDGSFVGEKILSEPLILNNVAIFTSFIPASAGITASACKPNDGTGSIFFVNVTDGTPTYDLSSDDTRTREDRKNYLDRGGIPPSPTVIITEEGQGTATLCVGTECDVADTVKGIQKLYWYEVEN